MEYRKTLPTPVDVALSQAMTTLTPIAQRLKQGKATDAKCNGNGRYEADAISNHYESPKEMRAIARKAWDVLSYWGQRCPDEIKFDELLGEYGELPLMAELEPSVEAERYFS